jgi:hypothetical protein
VRAGSTYSPSSLRTSTVRSNLRASSDFENVFDRRRVEADEELPKEERDRLGKFLKITANATAYGILARFDRRERSGTVNVFGPDEGPTKQPVTAVETPGPFRFPPVAATLTAAARLMLALLEREVTRAGGTYAFCDTDSLAIVATPRGASVPCPNADGVAVKALSRREVENILRAGAVSTVRGLVRQNW